MSIELLELPYGQENIRFALSRRDRKTMAISVRPDLGIEVVAPIEAPMEQVFDKVRKRAPWIRKQITYFSQFQPRTPERQYESGETHLYLGRQYRLKVIRDIRDDVKLYRGRLCVHAIYPKRRERTEELVQNWYRKRAHIKFQERLDFCRERFSRPEAFVPRGLIIRRLKQRWGSMTARGNLVLNDGLIRASVDTIDYVITHELCHLRHNHHGPEFYELLNRVMPDWESRKTKLERQLV